MSSAPAEPVRRLSRWPWLVFAFFLVNATAGLILVEASGSSLSDDWPYVIAFTLFGLTGALILSRIPGNRIGILLLYVSGLTSLSFVADEAAGLVTDRGGAGSLVQWLSVIGAAGFVIAFVPGLLLLLQVFPDGRPRWRWLIWATVAFEGGFLLAFAASPDFGEPTFTPNPLFVPALEPFIPGFDLVYPGFLVLMLMSVASLFVRFRTARGLEQQQIKWMGFAAATMVGSIVIGARLASIGVSTAITELIPAVGMAALPIAIAVAVLRYRLWDLDVVVRKAVLAAFVVLILMGVFGAVSLLGRAALGDAGVGDAVLAAAVGFAAWPAFRIARRLADRVVYGRRATPYDVLAGFSDRVAATYAGDDVLTRMATAVGEGIAAERVDVWLEPAGGSRLAATWPTDARADSAVSTDGEREAVFPVEFRGQRLGALGVRKPPGDRMNGADHTLVSQLASQAGPLLHNVSLTEELKARLVELHAAQRRLVTAQDEERRKLERNIHDGAQQQLVALAVKLKLTDTVMRRDPAKGHEMLAGLQEDAHAALDDLRDLARGVYPPLLADKGLAAALEAQARRSPIPVDVDAPDDLGRFPPEVEAAVYFSCLEGLQNIAKYAEAKSAQVSLGRANGHLVFSVRDDGRGFELPAASYGSGLQGIADRMAALAGDVEVRSTVGAGTTVSGRIPVSAVTEGGDG